MQQGSQSLTWRRTRIANEMNNGCDKAPVHLTIVQVKEQPRCVCTAGSFRSETGHCHKRNQL